MESEAVHAGSGVGIAVVFALGLVLWGLGSARLTRWNVTAPMAFVVLGLVSANPPLSLVEVRASSSALEGIAEAALALLLFSDAARVNAHLLRRDAGVPARLLGIGLPLTVGLGTAAALFCFGHLDLWLAAVVGAALAPTDAALGAVVVDDERVPARVRRALNVESGLNDGLASPVVTFCIAGAAGTVGALGSGSVGEAITDLTIGLLVGLGVGFVGALLLVRGVGAGWASTSFAPIAVMGLAALAFAGAKELDVNGFVAAFAGGLAFGSVGRRAPQRVREAIQLDELVGQVLALLLWFLFGALVVDVLDAAPSGVVLYAILSVTVVRVLPVALSLWRSGLHSSTVLFMGWFGPRGLASVVYGLIAFDSLPRGDGEVVLGAVAATVLTSVFVHGLTAGPLVARYARSAGAEADGRGEASAETPMPSRRDFS